MLTRDVKAGSSSSEEDFKVRVGIRSKGHDFEADFSIVLRTTFEGTFVNFANEQLEDCVLPAAGVIAGELSKSCHRFIIK